MTTRRAIVGLALLGSIIGSALGYGLFWVFKLQGPWPFVLGGALVGAIVPGLLPVAMKISSDLQVRDITISIPSVGEVSLGVDKSQKTVAWNLFIETATRISTQPLGEQKGYIREALKSLHELFCRTRELLFAMEPSRRPADGQWTVEMLAIAMLNDELRPFLSRWHPKLSDFERQNPDTPEGAWPENAQCRIELESTRARLCQFARAYGELAQVARIDHFFSE